HLILCLHVEIRAQNNADTLELSNLIGLWIPVDTVHDKMSFEHTCLEINATKWKTYRCEDKTFGGFDCPYSLIANEVRIVCHPKEQLHYKIKFLSEDSLILDSYWLKPSGKLKLLHKNIQYFKRE